MASKLEVIIHGTTVGLERALGRSSTMVARFAKVGVASFGVAAVAGAVFAEKSVKSFEHVEAAQASLGAQLKVFGQNTAGNRKLIDETTDAFSRQSGFLKTDSLQAFTTLERSTGNVGKSLKEMNIASDLARAKHMALAGAAGLLAKVNAGSFRALKQLGISFTPVTTAQDKLRESTKHATDAQKDHAKAQDAAASKALALQLIQQRVQGQTEAFAHTTEGAAARMGASWELLKEELGAKLAPTVAKTMTFIAEKMPVVAAAVGRAWSAVAAFTRQHWPAVRAAIESVITWIKVNVVPTIQAVVAAATAFWNKFGGDITRIARAAFNALRGIIGPALQEVKAIIELVLALIRGDWGKAWQSLQNIAKSALALLVGIITGYKAIIFAAARLLGHAIWEGVKAGAAALAGLGAELIGKINDAVVGAVKAAGDLGRAIGSAIRKGIEEAVGSIIDVILHRGKVAASSAAALADRLKGTPLGNQSSKERAGGGTSAAAFLSAAQARAAELTALQLRLALDREVKLSNTAQSGAARRNAIAAAAETKATAIAKLASAARIALKTAHAAVQDAIEAKASKAIIRHLKDVEDARKRASDHERDAASKSEKFASKVASAAKKAGDAARNAFKAAADAADTLAQKLKDDADAAAEVAKTVADAAAANAAAGPAALLAQAQLGGTPQDVIGIATAQRDALQGQLAGAVASGDNQAIIDLIGQIQGLTGVIDGAAQQIAQAATDAVRKPLDAAIALAGLTADTGDDIAALNGLLGSDQDLLAKALASGDLDAQISLANEIKSLKDQVANLTGATKANTDAVVDNTAAAVSGSTAFDYRGQSYVVGDSSSSPLTVGASTGAAL